MTVTCARCDAEANGAPEQLPEGWESHVATSSARTFIVCGDCASKNERTSKGTGDHAADQLRLFIERIERIEEEIVGMQADRRDVYAEAKATGFDARAMREVVKIRKMEKHDRQEHEAILETYKAALGLD